MRALISLVLIIVSAISVVIYLYYSPRSDFSGRLWESHELTLNQNEKIEISDSNRFISIKTRFSLLFIADGTFTASMKAIVEYKSGITKPFTQELVGSWFAQDDYVHMNVDTQRHVDQQTVMAQQSVVDEKVNYTIDHYAKILLNQTYIINYYKGNLVLISSHIGPIFTLTEKK